MDPLFTFRLAGPIATLLGLDDAAARAFVTGAGLPESALQGAATVPLSQVRALLDEAELRSGDPLFALRLADVVPAGTYDTAELLVRTAATLGEGLAALAEHASLVNPIGQFVFEVRKDTPAGSCALRYVVAGPRDGLGPAMNLYTIAYVLRGLERVLKAPVQIQRLWFAHAGPSKGISEDIQRHFGAPVSFDAATSGFDLPSEFCNLPLASSDPVVFAYLKRQAEKATLEAARAPFSATVARVILEEVGFAKADLAAVAKHLALTERTAQRRLAEEGTQFREILHRLRKRRAEELIGKGLGDERIAELLGFAEVTAYRRAKKRW